MPPEERDAAFLWDMRDGAVRILRLMQGVTQERFRNDEVLRLAAERLLLNVGEAARSVSPELRAAHPEIPWRKIVGQRNVLVHQYGAVSPDLVWHTIEHELVRLVKSLDPLLPPADA